MPGKSTPAWFLKEVWIFVLLTFRECCYYYAEPYFVGGLWTNFLISCGFYFHFASLFWFIYCGKKACVLNMSPGIYLKMTCLELSYLDFLLSGIPWWKGYLEMEMVEIKMYSIYKQSCHFVKRGKNSLCSLHFVNSIEITEWNLALLKVFQGKSKHALIHNNSLTVNISFCELWLLPLEHLKTIL